jgi:hypothetical protein
VNTEKRLEKREMFIARPQNPGQQHNNLANKVFRNMAKIKYLGTTITNRIQEKTKTRLN